MRILVTGGAGFIGSHLVDALVARGDAVHVLDDLSSGARVPAAAVFARADVRDIGTLSALLRRERIEQLVHLAAHVSVRRSLRDPLADASVNVMGGLAVLEASAASGVERVVLASSGGTIYGEGKGRPSRESDPPEPVSPYGAAKAALETYANCYRRTRALSVSCLRFSNVYGPRQNPEAECGVVARFLARMRDRRPLEVFGDGLQTRDYVFVADAVQAILASLKGPVGTYNVGTGVGTTLLELIELLRSALRMTPSVVRRPGLPGEIRASVLDVTRAAEGLGWRPRIALNEGIAITAGWGTSSHDQGALPSAAPGPSTGSI